MQKQSILKQFLYNNRLKFSEIEKLTKIRSNKLSYHVKQLTSQGILKKENGHYELTNSSEHIIPYISQKNHALSVILIHIGNKKEAFLHKRTKRPFKDKLGLPGGRILLNENIEQAVKRILKEKHSINGKLEKIHSISLEHIKKEDSIIQTDLILFVSAKTSKEIPLTKINGNKKNIIESDYKLIKEHLDKEIYLEEFTTEH